MAIGWIYVTRSQNVLAVSVDNPVHTDAEHVTDDSTLYYLPRPAEVSEDSASESMHRDVQTEWSDKTHNRCGTMTFLK